MRKAAAMAMRVCMLADRCFDGLMPVKSCEADHKNTGKLATPGSDSISDVACSRHPVAPCGNLFWVAQTHDR